MKKILVSSTRKDLQEHRTAVTDGLLRLGCHPLAMEHFGSRDGNATTVSLAAVAACDLFIGLYAHRYGFRPNNGRSVTELEYHEAGRLNKPRLLYVIDPAYTHPLIEQFRETDEESKLLLRLLLKDVQQNVVTLFTTPDQLTASVMADVGRWLTTAAPASANTSAGFTQIINGDVKTVVNNPQIAGSFNIG